MNVGLELKSGDCRCLEPQDRDQRIGAWRSSQQEIYPGPRSRGVDDQSSPSSTEPRRLEDCVVADWHNVYIYWFASTSLETIIITSRVCLSFVLSFCPQWWRHVFFKMLLLRQFLSELDDTLTQCSLYGMSIWSSRIVDPGLMTSLMTSSRIIIVATLGLNILETRPDSGMVSMYSE